MTRPEWTVWDVAWLRDLKRAGRPMAGICALMHHHDRDSIASAIWIMAARDDLEAAVEINRRLAAADAARGPVHRAPLGAKLHFQLAR